MKSQFNVLRAGDTLARAHSSFRHAHAILISLATLLVGFPNTKPQFPAPGSLGPAEVQAQRLRSFVRFKCLKHQKRN